MVNAWFRVTRVLDAVGSWLPQLALRLLLGWEFFESGREKLGGTNWFGDIRDNFPWPFSAVSPELSWWLATWFELVGAAMLVVGLFTRFWALSLFVLTVVAILAVHWGVGDPWSGDLRGYQSFGELVQGYVITSKGYGNYKLPLIFLVMLLPLIFGGPGRASLDHLIARRYR
jgi:putative oxidoreductase